MNTDEAATVYKRLFTAFPQVREWLAKVDDPKATYGIWCGVLAGVDLSDALSVVDSVIDGSSEPLEAYERERWPQFIRRGASAIRSKRLERDRVDHYHVTANETNTSSERFMAAMRESRRLGLMVRDGSLGKLENDAMVEDLISWSERGGPMPTWIGKDLSEYLLTIKET